MSIKALVTTLLLGSSSAVFAHPAPGNAVERTQVMRGDRVDYTSYDRNRGDRFDRDRDRGDRDRGDRDRDRGDRDRGDRDRGDRDRGDRDRNVRERGHGRHIDGGWHDRGRDRR